MYRNYPHRFISPFLSSLIGIIALSPQALALGENTGTTGSVTITRHANKAAAAFAAHDYKTAKDEYRLAISMSPNTLEFYYGLYDVCVHSGEWDQVAFALNKIFEIDPSKKRPLLAQYGEALYHLGQYDEALPVLKQALKEADIPSPKISLVVPPPMPETETSTPGAPGTVDASGNVIPVPPAIPDKTVASPSGNLPSVPVAPRETLSRDAINKFKLTFENAVHSECILVAEYEDYERGPDIHFFHPPIAKYHIIKILKGPPLNKDLPIRYEFYDRSNKTVPEGWKFGPDKLPEKGSKWLIFIMNALPRMGAFDTYEGSYGRQPASEENMDKVYSLLENSANR